MQLSRCHIRMGWIAKEIDKLPYIWTVEQIDRQIDKHWLTIWLQYEQARKLQSYASRNSAQRMSEGGEVQSYQGN